MQSGSSRRFFRLECVVLLALLGASGSLAGQYSPYGQALGTLSGQQPSCSSGDPNCQQPQDQGNYQGRSIPQANQQRPELPQGIVITGEPGEQNETTNLNGNLTQAQRNAAVLQNRPLPLDSPTEFQQ